MDIVRYGGSCGIEACIYLCKNGLCNMEEKAEGLWEGLKRYKHIWLLVAFCCVLLLAKSKAGERLAAVFSGRTNEEGPVVVIDAGHGGIDPGKVGTSGIPEKEINLAIAQKLQARLEAEGIRVVMTRTEDNGLYSEAAANKKREDMQARVRMIEEANPVLAVSIHQNSFPDDDCKGAQVFYYKDSEESKRLAEILQGKFPEVLKDGNTRQAKANNDYYLLRKTSCPIVIAECGFLSNPAEEALLSTAEYQEKVADVLYQGIKEYLDGRSER